MLRVPYLAAAAPDLAPDSACGVTISAYLISASTVQVLIKTAGSVYLDHALPLELREDVIRLTSKTSAVSLEHVDGVAPRSLPKLPNNGDDRWTDDGMAELEKELELALVEQVNSSATSAPGSPILVWSRHHRTRSKVKEWTDPTGSRPEELRDASRYGTPAQGLEELEQRETQVAVETLERRELQEDELIWGTHLFMHWGLE
ncbi:uncharacterized protein BP5553_10340 [Venustampulla echinocandica]|uniref:Uncharacterized protein n=1 Tax=Venustampulla echinocandica TaxID=2656787 RepID=A0A370TA01_9HELO|nr:uncharacterized protein BP5553_10340 [Venustampulla echinocandica]RDL30462.1 hypothetical protein BP5553_10340 [Venustampulla echinocandica]